MAELSRSKTGDVRTRVEDYVNDKIQTAADLDQLDSLIQRVQEQQDLLKKQLEDARRSYQEAHARVEDRSRELKVRAERYLAEEAEVQERQRLLAQSDASDDPVSKVEARMVRVRNLEIAQGHLEIVQQMNALSTQTRSNLSSQPETSVQAYVQLRGLFKQIQSAQPAAEDAAPQLVYEIEQHCNQLYNEVKNVLEENLRKILEQMKWPSKELNLIGNIRERWDQQVRLLLKLQDPDLITAFGGKDNLGPSPNVEPVVLLPLEVMVQPLAARFRYHFYGDKPTNRLDKPEYFLTHVLDLVERHSGFVSDMLGPIFDEEVLSSETLEAIYSDAVSAFITALLPIVLAKSLSFLPQISQEPQLLSHFMHELMVFDAALRDTWGYVPIPRMLTDWKGVTWKILTVHGYFAPWLAVEKDFALSRYRTIRDAADSVDVDFDADSTQTKPTKGAIRVNDLLETITDRYRGLSSFSQKIKFLLEIQLSIFDDYHNHLQGSLQAYLMAYRAGRLIPGQHDSDSLGRKGLESLAKIYGSAEFLERKMSDWSDDVFFLELWEELQYRAKDSNGHNASVGTGLRVADVAARTSATINSDDPDGDLDADGSGLFDQTALAYRRMRERSEEEILRALDVNLHAAFGPYARYGQWSSLAATPSEAGATAPSASLDGFCETTTVLLGYLARVLAPGPLRRITKHYCATVQREIYDNVLMHHTFSATGASQLRRDLSAIEDSIKKESHLPGVIGGTMKRLQEAVFLLSLDAVKPAGSGTGAGGDDGWGFDEDERGQIISEDATNVSLMKESDEWSLWDAEKLVFRSNEAARQALADMGLHHLSEGDARNVLKRRVELDS
ncbi:TIP-1 family-domain-containing protein [Exophiala viscosa]|uniref:TIP-1 family-domain-containing protein n=1 Tax=Exophiala viscosa TaxID=2486360 RepID=A0AAN6DNL7_9EURO|nr:TIP-1 family-domain-containing protein [Exophiala viscosa]KAI1621051.1 TIP-1 family-domain-containing protein [Exophiala viscosa]